MLTKTVNQFRDQIVYGRRAEWEEFKRKHPAVFKALTYGYSAFKLYRLLAYHLIYPRFRDYTMIVRQGFVNNLSLCDEYRSVPGAVVECGVWRGGMIAGIARLLGNDRDYYLFDSFEGLPPAGDLDVRKDGYPAKCWQEDLKKPKWAHLTDKNRVVAAEHFAHEAMARAKVDKVHIVKGWFNETLPKYDGKPIAILRIDGDFYESYMDCFNNLYQYVVKGGIVIFDDYYWWQGATRAVHDFLSANKLAEQIHQHHDRYAYIVKK
jgi:O-methyltransferase